MAERKGTWSGLDWRAGFLTAAVTLVIANLITLAVGFVAKSLQDSVDTPIFERIDAAGTSDFTDVIEAVTRMGNVRQTQILAVILALVLAVWFARRGWRWWMPILALSAAWWISRGFQFVLAKLVGRLHDVDSLVGTEIGRFPSGGVARIVIITGVAAFLVAYYARTSRRINIAMFTVVGVLGLVEAFARTRLNQHWFTDVIGGLVFGTLFLLAVIATIRAFDPERPPAREVSP